MRITYDIPAEAVSEDLEPYIAGIVDIGSVIYDPTAQKWMIVTKILRSGDETTLTCNALP